MDAGARSGAIAGAAGCAVFFALHAAWIVPIWFVGPVGFAIASASGAALGILVDRLRLPKRSVIRAVGAVVTAGLILAPAAAVAEAGLRVGNAPGILVTVGFLAPTLGAGAAVGWLGGRTRSAAAAGMIAAFLIAIGPGHNIPFLAGTRAAPLELSILAIAFGAGSVAFAIAEAISRWGARHQSAGEPTR